MLARWSSAPSVLAGARIHVTGGVVPERDERILVLADDAELAGPTLVLLRLLRWMRARTQLEFEVVVRRGGPALIELQRVCRVHVVEDGPVSGSALRRRWRAELGGVDVAAIYVATPRALDLVPLIPSRASVVCAVGEAGPVLEHDLGADLVSRLAVPVDRWVAADERTAAWLEPLVAAAVQVRPELLLVEGDPVLVPTPPADLLVLGWGPLSWDGGADRFVDLAAACAVSGGGPDVRWAWTGGRPQDPRHEAVVEDVAARASEVVVELEPDVSARLRPEDAALLVATARVGPAPLGAIEAARRGVPVVGLADAGVEEVAVQGGVVDHEAELREVVLGLLADGERRHRAGHEAALRAGDPHQVEHAAPRLVASLAPWLDPEGRLAAERVDGA